MLRWMLAGLTALALLAVPAYAVTLDPADEAAQDPQLAELIQTLIKACDAKDFKPFEAALTPDAIAGFGGEGGGAAGFRKAYKIDDPKTTFFSDFKAALTMGGAFIDPNTFGSPYIYAKWPDAVDAFTHVAAIGENVIMYDKPTVMGGGIADVSHMILELIPDAPDSKTPTPDTWVHVKSDDAQASGYVRKDKTRSSVDYRAIFQKTQNRWWLGAFVKGD